MSDVRTLASSLVYEVIVHHPSVCKIAGTLK